VAPTAQSAAATALTSVAATLSGRVNANDAPATYHFEWGTTVDYGAVTPDARASGHALTAVSAPLSGLTSATTYHFRVVATSPGGTVASPDATFTTAETRNDQAAPAVKIAPPTCAAALKGKACQAFLASTAAWKTLRGTATDPGVGASGVGIVELNLVRRAAAGKCVVYTGDGFRQMPCDKAAEMWVDAALSGPAWKLALRSLPDGTYTARVRATDRAGNAVTAFRGGQNQLTIKVS
jgi:hypothetical protein